MTTKLVDKKGRVVLGAGLAGRMVIIDDSDPTHIVITPAVAIAEHEAWLYKNEKALALVREGLAQARSGKFGKIPLDLDADAALANAIDS